MIYLFEYADKILCVLRALARTTFVLTHELSRRAKKMLLIAAFILVPCSLSPTCDLQ